MKKDKTIQESKKEISELLKGKAFSFQDDFQTKPEEYEHFHKWSFENRDDMDFFLIGIKNMKDLKEFVIDEKNMTLYCYTKMRKDIGKSSVFDMHESDAILSSILQYKITGNTEKENCQTNKEENYR